MPRVNVSLQILPMVKEERIYEIVDKIIEYIDKIIDSKNLLSEESFKFSFNLINNIDLFQFKILIIGLVKCY